MADAATIEFVKRWGRVGTYGGGREARIRIGDLFLRATDGWKGNDIAIENLADKVEKHLDHIVALTGEERS